MMRRFKRITLLFLFFSLCLGGCRNYQELNGFDSAAGMAVDWQDGQLLVTAEILDLSGGEETVSSKIVKSSGKTLPQALDGLRTRLSRELHLGNLQNIIIGETAAREIGLYTLCDWFLRDGRVRETVPLLIAQDDPAGDMLSVPGLDNPIAAYAIASILTPAGGVMNNPRKVSLYQAYGELDEPGKAISLPCIVLEQSGDIEAAAVNGLAVFESDRLSYYIGMEHLPFIQLLQNLLQQTEMVVETPDGPATIGITGGHTKTAFSQNESVLSFRFDCKAEGRILQLPPGLGILDAAEMEQLERLASETLRERVLEVLSLLQAEPGLDVPGLGNMIYKKDAVLWDKVRSDWQNWFRSLSFDVNAELGLYSAGGAKKS